MRIKKFFYKIKLWFARLTGISIPKTTQAKMYGSLGEDDFFQKIESNLPDCQIKRNVIIQTTDGNAEIDCLILYDDKLFAIEIKNWKGNLIEENGKFVQYKTDRWTNEIHKKIQKSPFHQLARAIYLLKKQVPDNVWINPIVYFKNADSIIINGENLWFDDIDNLILCIKNGGKKTNSYIAQKFFGKSIPADCLYARSFRSWLNCVVCDESVESLIAEKHLIRSDIKAIKIKHHFLYDDLFFITYDGVAHKTQCENAYINVVENGRTYKYSFSKLDFIELGKR